MDTLRLPEFTHDDMLVLAEQVKWWETNRQLPHDEAIVMGIFSGFNPDNLPMMDEDLEKVYTDFLTWESSLN